MCECGSKAVYISDSQCRPCYMKRYSRQRYLEQRDRIKARNRAYALAHAEENREWQAAYRRRHPEKVKAANQNWRLQYPERNAEKARRYAARKMAATVGSVSYEQVHEEEFCGICGLVVLDGTASVDHIVPLAAGGSHTQSNLQLAHRTCNTRKGARGR